MRTEAIYGAPPVDLGLVDISPVEMMFWLYCPIKLPGMHAEKLPANLDQFHPLVDAVFTDMVTMRGGGDDWHNSYVYLTAKTLWCSPDNPGNRPDWHCFSPDTEVLTDEGWKLFPQLSGSENVLSLDKETDLSRWSPITKVMSFPFDGYLNVHEGRRIDFAITDNHRLYAAKQAKPYGTTRTYNLTEYCDLPGQFFIKGRTGWSGTNPATREFPKGMTCSRAHSFDFGDWAEFVGWYVAEGSSDDERSKHNEGRICIGQQPGPLSDHIAALMRRMGFSVFQGPTQVSTNATEVARWLRLHCGKGFARKRVPEEIKNASTESINRFLRAHALGDGSPSGHGYIHYTSSRQLADDLHEMLCKVGRAKTLRCSRRAGSLARFATRESVRTADEWTVSESPSTDPRIHKNEVRKERFVGDVWCLQTPDQVFMVRRNGKPMWSGNSDGFLTDDLNYIWYDANPTVFWESDERVSFIADHHASLAEMEAVCEPDRNRHRCYHLKHLLRLDQTVMHKVDTNITAGVRTFVKISVSKDRYDLKGNSINHELAPDWKYQDRQVERNHPIGDAA